MTFRKENIHLIPNWFKSSCSQMCFLKLRKICLETSLLESLFNNVADLKAWNFIKKRLRHRCFPVNFMQFFKKPYLQNTSRWLLLLILCSNQSFIHWSHYVGFFLDFFSFVIDNCNYGILLKKCLKNKIFYFLQQFFTFYIYVVKKILPR